MTMLVGIHTGDAVFIAADKRAVYKKNGEVKSVVSDEEVKIVPWSGGYITGCGYVDLLDKLKHKISEHKIENTTQIFDVINEMNDELEGLPEEFVTTTRWVLSFCSGSEENTSPKLTYVEAGSNEVRGFEAGDCFVWLHLPADVLKSLAEQVKLNILRLDSFASMEEAFSHYLGIFNQLFQLGSEQDETVCSSYEFSVIFADGSKGDSFQK